MEAVGVFPRPRLLRFSARVTVAAWACMHMGTFGSVVALVFGWPMYPMAVLMAGAALMFVPVAASPFLRCPACRGLVTRQLSSTVHPEARTIGHFEGWAALVMDAVWRTEIVCFHCGTTIEVPLRKR